MQLYRALAAASLLVPLILFGVIAWGDRQDLLSQAQQDAARLTEIFHQHALHVFQTQQLAAERVDEHIRGMTWDEIAGSSAVQAYLKKIPDEYSQVQAIWLADASGLVRNASQPLPPKPVSVADRDYFRALQDRDLGAFIGNVVQARVMKGLNFNLAHRRHGGTGAFDGIIIVTVFSDYFIDFWNSVAPTIDTVDILFRGDGAILARAPGFVSNILTLPPDSPVLLAARKAEKGSIRAVSSMTGVERFYAFRKVDPYDVYMSTGVAVDAALAPWRRFLLHYGALFGVAAAALLSLSLMGLRQAREEQRTIHHWREATEKLGQEMQMRTAAQESVRKLNDTLRARAGELEAVNETLREVEDRFNALASNTPDHLLVQDRELRYRLVVNPQLGLTQEDMIGKMDRDFLSKEDADKLTKMKKQVLETGKPLQVETSLISPKGGKEFFAGSYFPKLNTRGQIDGLIGYFQNVTERKRAEEQIRQLNQALSQRARELEAANAELESFSYSVSHDLRAPLRAIDGFSKILLEEHAEKLDGEGQRVLNVVRTAAQKMGQLIDDILSFSRAGRLEMTQSEVSMEALARAALRELEPATAGRKLRIEVKALPNAYGDGPMLQRVWTNLLDNAVKFTGPKTDAVIELGGNMVGREAVYYVSDNGVGFDMQHVDKLFGVFQRLHGQEEFPGTGIGLAIVKRIVARHGGRVWAEGKLNEGATFHFTLPTRERGDA